MTTKIHPRASLTHQDFRLYLIARFLSLCAHQMLAMAISQHIYELTKDPLHLGYIGLALFLPKIGFTLLAGHTADRYDRWRVIFTARILQFGVVAGILLSLFLGVEKVWILYILLFLLGTAYAFDGPASQAFVTQLVPLEHFNNAVTWNSVVFQMALISGPALGGLLYAAAEKAWIVIAVVTLMRLSSALIFGKIRTRTGRMDKSEFSWQTVLAGIHYVLKQKIVLGAISLDLFAVLLGGAVALMPIFANEILNVGPWGLGILRAAPSTGAAIMAVALAYLPPMKKAGQTMFWGVALFGISTVLFGLSKNFTFSVIILVILGAADMVSVVIRGVLVQIMTPPEMRGRVSAVNLIFIGASNELGEFESGVTAKLFGTVPAVLIGGTGTLLVVALWAKLFPDLRKFGRLDQN